MRIKSVDFILFFLSSGKRFWRNEDRSEKGDEKLRSENELRILVRQTIEVFPSESEHPLPFSPSSVSCFSRTSTFP